MSGSRSRVPIGPTGCRVTLLSLISYDSDERDEMVKEGCLGCGSENGCRGERERRSTDWDGEGSPGDSHHREKITLDTHYLIERYSQQRTRQPE